MKNWKVLAAGAVSAFLIIQVMLVLVFAPFAAIAAVVLNNQVGKLVTGVACTVDSIKSLVPGQDESPFCKLRAELLDQLKAQDKDMLDQLKAEFGDQYAAEFDCSNAAPGDREKGRCVDGLIPPAEDQASPVPNRAAWQVEVWQKAAKKYKVPWELLAAVEGARTNFALHNCYDDDWVGPYRMPKPLWEGAARRVVDEGKSYRTDAGYAKTEKTGGCRTTKEPAKFKPDGRADAYDAVDATFAEAKLLADNGAKGKKSWNYNGADRGSCTTPSYDGQVTYPPGSTGAELPGIQPLRGKRLTGLRKGLATVYFPSKNDSMEGSEGAGAFSGVGVYEKGWGVARFGRYDSTQDAWPGGARAWGLVVLKITNTKNGKTVYAPVIDVGPGVPRSTPAVIDLLPRVARALNNGKVDNVMVKIEPVGILSTAEANKYSTGAKSPPDTSAVKESKKDGEKAGRFKGKRGSDDISKAVAYMGSDRPTASSCYIAVVREWYKAIKENPPVGSVSGLRGRIIQILLQEKKLGLKEAGVNCGAPLDKYWAPGACGDCCPWCAMFATWVWRKAGVKIDHLGHAQRVVEWGQGQGVAHPADGGYRPQPGDAVIYFGASSSTPNFAHIGIVWKTMPNGQFISIDGNLGDTVGANADPHSPGHPTWFVEPGKNLAKYTTDKEGDYSQPDLPSKGRLSYEQLGRLVLWGGWRHEDAVQAVATIMGESGGDPRAYGVNKNGSNDAGLWMINSVNKVPNKVRYDPYKSTKWSRKLFLQRGWQPWYANGTVHAGNDAYRAALPRARAVIRRLEREGAGNNGNNDGGGNAGSAAKWASKRKGDVSYAVADSSGHIITSYRGDARVRSASLSKAMVMAAMMNKYGSFSSSQKSLLSNMIRNSDNGAANTLFRQVGQAGIDKVAREADMTHYRFATGSTAYILGDMYLTANDQARFWGQLYSIIPKRHHDLARSLLSSVNNGRWGVFAVSSSAQGKSGWRPEVGTGRWTVNNGGRLDGVGVAVLTKDNPSQSYGEDSDTGVVRRLFPNGNFEGR